ncbi:MAG: tRNA (guanine(10)-N(2))-dimethyltransferase, partial [Archaeoglobaceae archaeon]
EATRMLEKIGYIAFCEKCLSKKILKLGEAIGYCKCGGKFAILGPLWLGELKDQEFVKKVLSIADGKFRNFIQKIQTEIDYPLAYSLPSICSKISKPVPSTSKIVDKLRDLGFMASSTHYCGYCVKTDAEIEKILEILST